MNESKLAAISSLVETFSGKNISENTPILGSDVFTQTAGVHADGDAKGDLYATPSRAAAFRARAPLRARKTLGKSSLDYNLERLGIDLSQVNRQKVLDRIIELGDKKHNVVPEDLLMIIADVLKTPAEHVVKIDRYAIDVGSDKQPRATVAVSFRGRTIEAEGSGDGGYEAFHEGAEGGRLSAWDGKYRVSSIIGYESRREDVRKRWWKHSSAGVTSPVGMDFRLWASTPTKPPRPSSPPRRC